MTKYEFIVYMSIASPYLPDQVVDVIANEAAKKNEKLGISGLLVKKGRYFVQYIEGDPGKLKFLFEKIKKDDRHSDIVVLEQGPILEPIFADWHMQSNEKIIKVMMKRLLETTKGKINRSFYFLNAMTNDETYFPSNEK